MSGPVVDAVRRAATWFESSPDGFGSLLEMIGDARLVLIGEASHGTHEFYAARAGLTKALILEKGFSFVAVEADWPDAYRANQWVRYESADADAEAVLASFKRRPGLIGRDSQNAVEESIAIPAGRGQIEADLRIPEHATGLVIFAHGSGSSRFSRRNRAVAGFLETSGFATLLVDLLTREEEAIDVHTSEYRFDIDRLARRVVLATDWAQARDDLKSLSLGYFGASTGAAAALIAAAERAQLVGAVVSRGGRPDLADGWLPKVLAPTLLIVGGHDERVIGINREAMRQMDATVELAVVPGATHLFEEPGVLEQVMQLATAWFRRYMEKL